MLVGSATANNWNLIGHERAVERLTRLVNLGSFPPAMLVTGVPGTGRRALALAMAKATFCSQAETAKFCNTCESCRLINAGSHPDVQVWSIARQEAELSGKSLLSLRIETIRHIAGGTSVRPQLARHRFVVIDDAETLENAAQQAMLKMLEDAPGFLTIVLVATRADSLLATVRSRCVEIPLQLVSTDKIASAISGPDGREIAALATGRPGWAIAASSNPTILPDERDAIAGLEQWIAMAARDRRIEAYKRGEKYLARGKSDVAKDRQAVLGDLNRLQIIWRDLILSAIGSYEAIFDPDRVERIRRTLYATAGDSHRALVACVTCHSDLTGNVRPRLALQAMVNQWPTQ
jgi:DNA polymerase-3 subunit delta'